MRVIRHVDDMGSTPAITTRIVAAWRAGQVDSFSVLANGSGLAELRRALLDEPDRPARIAAHLNLSEGPSCAPAEQVPLLVDAEGRLRHTFASLLAASLGPDRRAFLDQVRLEWAAQIEAVRSVVQPRAVQAVDGHIHVHMLPALFPVAAELATEHAIPEVRITREPLHLSRRLADTASMELPVNLVKHGVLRVLARRARPLARRAGLRSPDRFVGVLYTGRMSAAAASAGTAAARRRGAESVELLFHIGRAAPSEAERWPADASPAVRSFPLSSARDREHAELARYAARTQSPEPETRA